MIKFWAFLDDGEPVDGWIWINPLHVMTVRDNGQGHSLLALRESWCVVQGNPEEVARKISDALEGL